MADSNAPGMRRAKITTLSDGFHSTRQRFGKDQRQTFKILLRDEDAAQKRADVMMEVADMLTAAGHVDHAAAFLKKIAEASEQATVREVHKLAEKLCEGRLKVDDRRATGAGLTFRMVAERWVTGQLHRDFPDQVEDIDQEANRQRLGKHVYPTTIATLPIRAVTREHCDEVMRKLPAGLSRSSRRHIGQVINRVLNLAELAGYIDRNPLPRGWLPKPSNKKRSPILYPAEDRALLGCTIGKVPLAYRVLYAFLHREGVRRGEAAKFQWRDFDLEHGTVALDENKTDHPRMWKLSPGMPEALKAWHRLRGTPRPSELVFVDEHGRPLSVDHLADLVRAHLEAAGVTRADLFSVGPNKLRFGTHGFRHSFVTRSLANGCPEDWVRQRTGHTSEELHGYREASRSLAELHLGELDRPDLAIPELTTPATPLQRGVGSGGWAEGGQEKHREGGGTGRRAGFRFGSERAPEDTNSIVDAASCAGSDTEKHSCPPRSEGVGSCDAVEEALAYAVLKATEAEQWELIGQLARELEARRKARSEVVDLNVERERRKR